MDDTSGSGPDTRGAAIPFTRSSATSPNGSVIIGSRSNTSSLGMDEHHWLGQTELAGRMLRRIGLALVEQDPEPAAIIVGAGMARSQASTLTERVNQHHRERIAVLEASLGAERCRTLMQQGAAMADNEAVALAHAAAERALTNMAAEDRHPP